MANFGEGFATPALRVIDKQRQAELGARRIAASGRRRGDPEDNENDGDGGIKSSERNVKPLSTKMETRDNWSSEAEKRREREKQQPAPQEQTLPQKQQPRGRTKDKKLNDQTYDMLNQQTSAKRQAQEEVARGVNATRIAALRAASLSTAPLDPIYINAINSAAGLTVNDPYAYTGIFPVIDKKTGTRLGVGATRNSGKEVDANGRPKQIQEMLDPRQFLPKLMESFDDPVKAEEFAQNLVNAGKATFDDFYTVLAKKQLAAFALARAKAQGTEQGKIDTQDKNTLLERAKASPYWRFMTAVETGGVSPEDEAFMKGKTPVRDKQGEITGWEEYDVGQKKRRIDIPKTVRDAWKKELGVSGAPQGGDSGGRQEREERRIAVDLLKAIASDPKKSVLLSEEEVETLKRVALPRGSDAGESDAGGGGSAEEKGAARQGLAGAPTGATPSGGGAATQDGVTRYARLSADGRIAVTENGVTRTLPDTPNNRTRLHMLGITFME